MRILDGYLGIFQANLVLIAVPEGELNISYEIFIYLFRIKFHSDLTRMTGELKQDLRNR